MKLGTKYEIVEHLTEINKLRKVVSCRLHSANISAMHGPANVKFKRNKLCLWSLGENKYKWQYRVPSANSTSCQIIR